MRGEGAKTVGIVGLGLIGISLARRLLGAGFEVHGYDVDPKRNALLKGSAAYNRAMDTRGEKMIRGDFTPHGKVHQSRKDFTLMHQAARRSGQELPLAKVYLDLIEACVANGESDLDNSAVFNELRRRRARAKG